MSQWVEIRHLYLVEGVAKKRIARRWQLDIKTVRPRRGAAEAAERDRAPWASGGPDGGRGGSHRMGPSPSIGIVNLGLHEVRVERHRGPHARRGVVEDVEARRRARCVEADVVRANPSAEKPEV